MKLELGKCTMKNVCKNLLVGLFVLLCSTAAVLCEGEITSVGDSTLLYKPGDVRFPSLSKLIWARQPEQASRPTLASQSNFLASVDIPNGSQSADAQDA